MQHNIEITKAQSSIMLFKAIIRNYNGPIKTLKDQLDLLAKQKIQHEVGLNVSLRSKNYGQAKGHNAGIAAINAKDKAIRAGYDLLVRERSVYGNACIKLRRCIATINQLPNERSDQDNCVFHQMCYTITQVSNDVKAIHRLKGMYND